MGKHVTILTNDPRLLVNLRGPVLMAMVERGHRVTACTPRTSASIRASLASMGVKYREVNIDSTGLNPLRDLRTFRELRAVFAELCPDILFAYTIKSVIYGSLAARRAGVPERFAMIPGRGYAFANGGGARAWLVGNAARYLYRRGLAVTRNVFFHNPDDRTEFKRLGLLQRADQGIVINGSGVDLEHYAPAPLPSGCSFLLLARMLRDKGILEYVEAARGLKAHYPELRFRIAGWFDGNPMTIPRSDVEAWHREAVIEYLGDLQDVRPAIRDCSVYVLPSYYPEGLPRSILEAMAMGRPIITTDMPGCRETVDDGVNGFLVPPRSAEAIADAMERFVRDPDLAWAMGRVSRRMAEERFDVRKVVGVMLETMGL